MNNTDVQSNNNFAIEFRHASRNTEGILELLQHYDIASVLTDSPAKENLEFLSNENNIASKSTSVVRLHGRNTTQGHFWYNYLYSQKELNPWFEKIEKMNQKTESIFVCFNNHYGDKELVNAL
jgi:uncharacterized protein YecE (DUF72 family)